MADYIEAVNIAIERCPHCQALAAEVRQVQRQQAYRDVLRTQSRALEPLPTHVWPQGHSPI